MPAGDSAPSASGTAAATSPRGLVGYDPSLDNEILRFNLDAYPTRRVDWVEPRWRWMFLESAARLPTEPMVWMYRAKTGIVAHQGAMAVRLWAAGRELTTGWFVETMTLESHRGKAIGPMLVKKALEDLPLNLSLGQTEEMRAIQFAMGWTQTAPLETFVFVLRPAAVLRGKVAPALRPAAAAALWTAQRARGWRSMGAGDSSFSVRPVSRFGSPHDRLWERTRSELRCAVVRDASYLNWKYVDQPGQDFGRLEILRDGEPAAVVAVVTRDPDTVYAYRRGFIVDLLAPPSDRAAVRVALQAACDELTRREADLVSIDLTSEALRPQVLAFGFVRRSAERVLLVATGGAAPEVADAMRDPRAWLVTMGDSDIDRPW